VVRAGPNALPTGLQFWYTVSMGKSIKVHQKKLGRPATGRDPAVTIRLPEKVLADVEAWAAKQDSDLNRSQAVRRLVELGLTVKTPARPVSKPGRRLRAQELATKAIEKMIDLSAPADERAQRRRHLTKGPSEFREDRVDLPRAKK
jgi:hypothetical protein